MPLNIVLRRFAFYGHNYRTSKKTGSRTVGSLFCLYLYLLSDYAL